MVAALIVTLVIVIAAVGWFVFANPATRPESRETSVAITAPLLVPASAAATFASGHEKSIILVTLPSAFDRYVTVKSESEQGKTYQVNMGQLTCTCQDFEERRASLPAHDIRRVCKHLGRTLEATDALSHYDEVAQAFIRPPKASRQRSIKHGVSAERFVALPDGADELVLAFSASAWVDVVTRRGTNDRIKKYKRYSYNIHERRWSYGSMPFSDAEIRQAIHTHVRG